MSMLVFGEAPQCSLAGWYIVHKEYSASIYRVKDFSPEATLIPTYKRYYWEEQHQHERDETKGVLEEKIFPLTRRTTTVPQKVKRISCMNQP